ncbi:MAG: ABC transporter permease [Armatimonadota bacterium]|nr:ABC transporter permease [Armatimonadota bacterium]MDR7449848.1 ABC transporter permease [Armatimonadota bacterium]MDR7459128.1 ABC transporter permease [Armatimonadota bacterium]MDR7480402.1 ABC transporter permease [Armatimonadota bacterium]MDR7489412.1 ABC transporter permease [Armatimonadota bacterium]
MWTFLLIRSARAAAVLLGLSIVVFMSVRLIPGDPALVFAGDYASPAVVAQVRERFGLDRPWVVQYVVFVRRALAGDLGASVRTGQPVIAEIAPRYARTIVLAAAATLISLLVGLPLGVLAAVRRGGWVDRASIALALLGVSAPTFVVAVLLQYVLAVRLGWLPVTGGGSLRHLVLPAVSLGVFPIAAIARLVRAGLLEVLGEDYIRTARAKGLPEAVVLVRHALRPALIPTATVVAVQFGTMLGAAVFAEAVFAWPGLGRYLVQAVSARDYPVVQAAVLALGATYILANLAVDLLYRWLDPRIA